MTTTRQQQETNAQFATLLKLADQLGCQLQPIPATPSILRGLCPFHQSDSIAEAKTLMVNVATARFWCVGCSISGYPVTFAAKTWHVSARDARMLMRQNPDAGIDRPQYASLYHNRTETQQLHLPQNSAVLTRASHFYATQLKSSYDPLHFLARLGVHPDIAAKAGIGYSTGHGLKQYLLDNGINESEVKNSPLFQDRTGLELFTGRFILSDQDLTGASMWLTSFEPDQPTEKYTWGRSSKTMLGLPGQKPYLFNVTNLANDLSEVVLTEDQRLYIILKAIDHPVILITQRRRATMDLQAHVRRIVESITAKAIKTIFIAVSDRQFSDLIKSALEQHPKAPEQTVFKTRPQVHSFLHIATRDITTPPHRREPSGETPTA